MAADVNADTIRSRACVNCETSINGEDVFDTWGEESPLQIVCYLCPECSHTMGYFRDGLIPDDGTGTNGLEFHCHSMDEYSRLYGDEIADAMHHVESGERISVPEEFYDVLDRRDAFTERLSVVFTTDTTNLDRTIRRGDTIALPPLEFKAIDHHFSEVDEDMKPELRDRWFIANNVRVVPEDGTFVKNRLEE